MAVSDQGSIPAGAGEPLSNRHNQETGRVYPRGRGGAGGLITEGYLSKGLSPRARGSHGNSFCPYLRQGSIPAGAGEPNSDRNGWYADRVYPRGRGGAAGQREHGHEQAGLSPRARGSRRAADPRYHRMGSIPAGAGEPGVASIIGSIFWVYPRGRGGAPDFSPLGGLAWGLSPRARGSQAGEGALNGCGGSIPAGAGEPSFPVPALPRSRVYPRGRGGAFFPAWKASKAEGLSPRARGSLPARHRRAC